MLVAKLPGSTYAIAATNAGPMNGSAAAPARAPGPARRTRSLNGCLMDCHDIDYVVAVHEGND